MKLAVILVILTILPFILTQTIRYIAIKRQLFDVPNLRSSHSVPTPTGGGLAIVITWYLGITVLFYLHMVEKPLYYALMCGIILAVVSFIDDYTNLRPSLRLLFHFITAILAFYFLGGLRAFIIPGIDMRYFVIIYPVAIVGIVWFINLFNFMDGLDGFASTEAIILAIVMFFYSGNIINIILVVSIIGFLYWNWPRAKIFMGDVGSIQLGFILIVLGIYFHNTYKFSILNWIMLASPFWFDATYTLYRRWRNKEKLSQAHKKHVYQRIAQAGFSHQKVNFYLIGINLMVILIIIIYREIPILKIPLFILSLVFFYTVTRVVDKKVPFK